jgi:hypothetical protein
MIELTQCVDGSYPPFYDEDPMKTYQKIIAGKINFPPHFRSAFKHQSVVFACSLIICLLSAVAPLYSKEAQDLITHLLEPKAPKRLGVVKGGADLIKHHPFFKGFDWHALITKKMTAPIPRPVASNEDTQNFDSSLEVRIGGTCCAVSSLLNVLVVATDAGRERHCRHSIHR